MSAEIIKDNKLLAEYLGYVIIVNKDNSFDVEDKDGLYMYWNPIKDWNQLMLVIEKIKKKLNDRYSPCRYYDLHDILTMLANSFVGKHNYDISDIHKACAEYIKSNS